MRRIGGRLTDVTVRSGRMRADGRSTGFDDGRAPCSADTLAIAMQRAGSELSEPPDDLTVSRLAAVAALNRRAVAGIDDSGTINHLIGRPASHRREERIGPHWRWVGAVAAMLIMLVVGLNLLMPALPPTMITTGGDGARSTPALIGPASAALYEPDGTGSPASAAGAGSGPATTSSTIAPTPSSTAPSTSSSAVASGSSSTASSTVASTPRSTVSSTVATTVSSTSAPASPNGSPGRAGPIPASGGESSPGTAPDHGLDVESDVGGTGGSSWPSAMTVGESEAGSDSEALLQTYPLGEAGAVTVSLFGGRLQLVSVDACDRCAVDIEVDTNTELVMRVSNGSIDAILDVELNSGRIAVDIRLDTAGVLVGTVAAYPLGEAGEVTVEFGLDQVTVVGVVGESGWWQSSAQTVSGRTGIEFRDGHDATARLEAGYESGDLRLVITVDVSP